MTLANILFESKVRLKRGVVSVSLDELTLRIIFNMSLQNVYRWSLLWDPTYYYKSQAFGSTASLAKPSDFGQILHAKATGAAFGAARIVTHRQFDEIQNNSYISGQASSPVCLVNQSTIDFAPAFAGTLYYIKKLGEISDLTYDISLLGSGAKPALIPWLFEEILILDMVRLARERHLLEPEIEPSELKMRMDALSEAKQALGKLFEPLNIYVDEIQTPALYAGGGEPTARPGGQLR